MKLRAEIIFLLLMPVIVLAWLVTKLWRFRWWIVSIVAVCLFVQWAKRGYDPVTGDWIY